MSAQFWEKFYDAIREMIFSDKVYVFREIVNEPKTIREIADKLGMPYVTVRKYIQWGYKNGLTVVVGTKKDRGAISEKWLLTFVSEVLEVKEDNLLIEIRLRINIRREFCEGVCPFKSECPNFLKMKNGEKVVPKYRDVELLFELMSNVFPEVWNYFKSGIFYTL